jgi:hypothetical protein
MKPAKILFFIAGALPTKEDYETAAKYGNNANVVFRNASQVSDEPHALEMCDGVTGAVPKLYAEKFPTAEKAIEAKKKEFKKLTDSIEDAKPPKPAELSDAEKAELERKKAEELFKQQNGGSQGGNKPAWNANK